MLHGVSKAMLAISRSVVAGPRTRWFVSIGVFDGYERSLRPLCRAGRKVRHDAVAGVQCVDDVAQCSRDAVAHGKIGGPVISPQSTRAMRPVESNPTLGDGEQSAVYRGRVGGRAPWYVIAWFL